MIADKPANLSDRCYDGNGHKVSDELCGEAVVTTFGTPRTVAGDAITTDANKCQLRPLNRDDDYGPIPFTDSQWATVETIPWQTYQDDAAGGSVIYGGTPLGPPPKSH